jgi:hypothetical protein
MKTIAELYFHDPAKPPGQRFLSITLIELYHDPSIPFAVQAAEEAWRLNANPGGEVLCYEHPISKLQEWEPYMNRLLTEDEGISLGIIQRTNLN